MTKLTDRYPLPWELVLVDSGAQLRDANGAEVAAGSAPDHVFLLRVFGELAAELHEERTRATSAARDDTGGWLKFEPQPASMKVFDVDGKEIADLSGGEFSFRKLTPTERRLSALEATVESHAQAVRVANARLDAIAAHAREVAAGMIGSTAWEGLAKAAGGTDGQC